MDSLRSPITTWRALALQGSQTNSRDNVVQFTPENGDFNFRIRRSTTPYRGPEMSFEIRLPNVASREFDVRRHEICGTIYPNMLEPYRLERLKSPKEYVVASRYRNPRNPRNDEVQIASQIDGRLDTEGHYSNMEVICLTFRIKSPIAIKMQTKSALYTDEVGLYKISRLRKMFNQGTIHVWIALYAKDRNPTIDRDILQRFNSDIGGSLADHRRAHEPSIIARLPKSDEAPWHLFVLPLTPEGREKRQRRASPVPLPNTCSPIKRTRQDSPKQATLKLEGEEPDERNPPNDRSDVVQPTTLRIEIASASETTRESRKPQAEHAQPMRVPRGSKTHSDRPQHAISSSPNEPPPILSKNPSKRPTPTSMTPSNTSIPTATLPSNTTTPPTDTPTARMTRRWEEFQLYILQHYPDGDTDDQLQDMLETSARFIDTENEAGFNKVYAKWRLYVFRRRRGVLGS